MIRAMPFQLAAPAACLFVLAAAAAQAPTQQTPQAAPAAPPTGLTPGQLPANASEGARAAWENLVKAARGEASAPIRAFQLKFDATVYSGDKQSNDGETTYKFLAPDCVSMVLASGRERMRGRSGDFLVDKNGVYSLKGKEYKEDERELSETLAVAKLFVGLTEPSRLRLASLELLSAPPAGLPESQSKRAAELEWIALTSPDFLARASHDKETLDRVEIGLDRAEHLPALAIVTDPAKQESAVLAQLEKYQLLDGYRVPSLVTTWRVAPAQPGATARAAGGRPPFSPRAAVKLWLIDGSLRAKLEPKDFEPPA
jgi:hypothetical protein